MKRHMLHICWIKSPLQALFSSISFFILLLLVGCAEVKKEDKKEEKPPEVGSLQLDLKSELGYGSFLPNREILFPLQEDITYQGVPEYLENYVVRAFVLQKNQHYYNQYKAGKITEERFQQIKDIFDFDEALLSEEQPATQLLFLLGTTFEGQRIIIPDTNQNFDFSDDETLKFEFPLEFIDEDDEEFFEENQEQFLPKAKFTIDYVKNTEVEKRDVIVVVNPYRMETEVNFYSANPKEQDYFIAVSFPKVMKTDFEVAEQGFQVEAANEFLHPFYYDEEVKFNFFQRKGEEKILLNKRPFQVGDTINLNQFDYQITSFSEDGKSLHMENIGKNEKPMGTRMGNYFPLSEVFDFQGEKFDFPNSDKAYQLLYFWTLEEKRSLREVPDLKEIDTSKVQIVGFSVDENAGAAHRMQVRRKMEWKNFHLDPNAQPKTIQQLQLERFPTYFLLDQEGKIVLRSVHLSEIKRKL